MALQVYVHTVTEVVLPTLPQPAMKEAAREGCLICEPENDR